MVTTGQQWSLNGITLSLRLFTLKYIFQVYNDNNHNNKY